MSVKIAFVTDLHVREDRLAEQQPLLDEAIEYIVAEKPDLVLIGGDLAGKEVPHRCTIAERNALVRFFTRIKYETKSQLLIVRGNHDPLGEFDFLNAIPDIDYFETPTVETVMRFHDPASGENDASFRVVALPWLDRSQVEGEYTEGVMAAYLAAIEKLAPHQTNCMGKPYSATICLGHGALIGGEIRIGQPPVLTEDPKIDFAQLQAVGKFDAAFWGHYHDRQILKGDSALYGGALFVNEYGEDQLRGVTFWTPENPYYFIPLVGNRPRWMVDVNQDFSIFKIKPETAPGVQDVLRKCARPGALFRKPWTLHGHVKLRVTVHSADLGETRMKLDELAQAWRDGNMVDSIDVEYDVIASTRTRVEPAKLAASQTAEQKFDLFLTALDEPPEQSVIDIARQELVLLEGEIGRSR